MIIYARKRSLGQGNIFTPVCHSVHRGRVVSQHALQQGGGIPACLAAGGSGPGGSAPGGCLVQGGLLLRGVCSGGGCLVETPPRRLLLQAVRILLECILVVMVVAKLATNGTNLVSSHTCNLLNHYNGVN